MLRLTDDLLQSTGSGVFQLSDCSLPPTQLSVVGEGAIYFIIVS